MANADFYGAGLGDGGDTMARLAGTLGAVPWASWAGALTSLALVGGLTVWAVDLTLRDVRAVPVIRAMEGPMRVAPDDPGGAQAAHQGLALSEIAAGGAASPAPDTITLAPLAAGIDAPTMAARAEALQAATAPPPVTVLGDKVDALTAEVETVAAPGEPAALSDLIDATVADALDDAASGGGSAVSRSARPPRRPDALAGRAA